MKASTTDSDRSRVDVRNGIVAMPRVLLIDDDVDLTEMLVEYLGPEGFSVDTAHSGEQGLAEALTAACELVILDVMLPEINGFEALRRLRSQSKCPVIMLTARGQEVDRIVGLEIGSDGYLAKPFSVRELVERMNAVLRRTSPAVAGDGDVYAASALVLDSRASTVRRNGQLIELTAAEFDVPTILLA